MDALKLWLLDGTGKVLKKYSTVVNDSDEIRGHFLNYNDANLGYIKEENSILMHFVHEDEGASKFDPKSIFPIVRLTSSPISIYFYYQYISTKVISIAS